MKLIIDNIAKIRHAEIDVNGITVIAGNNDTGKSTIGKVLFAMFNSMNEIEHKLSEEKKATLTRNFISIIESNLSSKKDMSFFLLRRRFNINKIVDTLESDSTMEDLVEVLNDSLSDKFEYTDSEINDISKKIKAEYKRVSEIPNAKVIQTIVSRYFNEVFDGQINSLRNETVQTSSVELIIKGKKIKNSFAAGICDEINQELEITKKAIYIDNPFILDNLQDSEFGAYVDNYLQDILMQQKDVALEKGVYDSVDIKDKLASVEEILNNVINGEILEKDYDLVLSKEGFKDDIHLQNVSTGLKAFILLKLLLQKQILTNKDILVLDEPEIHLHPEWQLKYAESIVLLQKVFDLNIVITTHSSTFLEAIDLFSKLHSVNKKCNYYLSKDSEIPNMSEFENVTKTLDKVYKSLVTPTMALMRIRESLELKDND